MPAIIYDFKAIGGALRTQWLDDWWQPLREGQRYFIDQQGAGVNSGPEGEWRLDRPPFSTHRIIWSVVSNVMRASGGSVIALTSRDIPVIEACLQDGVQSAHLTQ